METNIFIDFYALVMSLPILLVLCKAADTVTKTHSITDGTTLVSSGQRFELGFFSPGSSKNRYLGIWYKTAPDVVVWVANRNNPFHDSSGKLVITDHGNLLLLNQTRSVIWSTNTSWVAKEPIALLLDSGNFVVGEKNKITSSEIFVWQSFDYPSNTLSGMKIGWNRKTGLEGYLTSWKSDDDPSDGDFTYRMDNKGPPQMMVTMGQTRMFRTGTWNGVRFSGLPAVSDVVFKSTVVFNDNESYYMALPNIADTVITRMTLNSSGLAQRFILRNGETDWAIMYSQPYEPCDSYGHCGPNGICRINRMPICECLEGFTPRNPEEWKILSWSRECVRKNPLTCQKGEGFVKLVGVKLPDLLEFWSNQNMSLRECKEMCLKNCPCKAYANSDIREGGNGCMMWFGDFIDVRELSIKGSEDSIYIRVSASDMKTIREANAKSRLKKILVNSLSVVCIFCLVFCSVYGKIRKKIRGFRRQKEDIELPLFDLATVASATKNFSPERMIGAGGFGSVYKGNLSTGQEIAVKRLAQNSGQGLKEFMNEVDLIGKLQHRNLVALLGCCIERKERILIYEFMPNESLDHFIFDNKRSTILCWEKRFNIVLGIARGLLYLHRDSKLQIIHMDLKAGNILLDKNLNPKISDFGLARIFGGDENEARTRRVVGT
ncbi:G-type lectin S-receptor-like serine/threonine-protein kinase At4g27290 isoform X2 [Ziziphus jujuba]|nr:G-type lectin S-receptor-like serine/threonine-protein kinase At4g27290 isoform X2 [Ziziphus jujuba]